MEAEVLQIELQRENLTIKNLPPLQERLAQLLKQLQQTLVEQPQLLQQAEVFLVHLTQTLASQVAFGLNTEDGTQGELNAAANDLLHELGGLSALVTRFTDVRNLEKDFLLALMSVQPKLGKKAL